MVNLGDPIDPSIVKSVKNEARLMKLVNSENVIKVYEFQPKVTFWVKDKTPRNVSYISLKLAENGDLIEIMEQYGILGERIAKYYFWKLIDTLELMHSKGICHLDIKPENILFDEDYNLKLCDFGYSLNSIMVGSKKGTSGYAAPEIYEKEIYSGPMTDVFSAGVVLFIMVVGHPPFSLPFKSDIRYKYFHKNNLTKFWDLTWNNKGQATKQFSDDFKELINAILVPDPQTRLCLSEIKMHSWWKKDVPTLEEVQDYFNDFSSSDEDSQ